MSDPQALPSPRRRWPLLVGLALLIGGGIWYFGFRETPKSAAPSRPGPVRGMRGGQGPVPVRVVEAQRQALPVHLKAIGTVAPLNTVTVRSRVDGQLLRVLFEEGQHVEKGQLLAEIDPRSYEVRLAQAEAQARQNLAQLESARNDLERFRQLHQQTFVTSQQLEQQETLVREYESSAAGFRAQVDDAKLQLAYTRVEAPISGRLGLRLVDVGNLVRAGDSNGLVVITQTQPISVLFTIPETHLASVLDPLRAGEQMEVTAWDRNEQTQLARGVLKTVDNRIDTATGTLKIKAEFPNRDERLFPNQFVNVRLRVQVLENALVIPTATVQYGSRGTYVYVVNERNQAVVRDLSLGPSDGLAVSVTQGLQPGEKVVIEGLDRLRDGREVQIVDTMPTSGT